MISHADKMKAPKNSVIAIAPIGQFGCQRPWIASQRVEDQAIADDGDSLCTQSESDNLASENLHRRPIRRSHIQQQS